MRVGLESWLVEDGKVAPLKRGDVLVCGLEVFVRDFSVAEPAPPRRPIRRIEDLGGIGNDTGVFYEINGHPVTAEWFHGDMWLLEASGIQFALTGIDPPLPMPASDVLVRGSVWVPWRCLHRGPLTLPWRVERIFRQTASIDNPGAGMGPDASQSGHLREIDHIERWPEAQDRHPYRYLLDVVPLDRLSLGEAGDQVRPP